MKHLTRADLDVLYQRAGARPSEVLALLRHVETCADCAAKIEPVVADEHLTEEDMSAYVDGAADRDWMDDHLTYCATCRNEVADLQQWAETLRARRSRRAQWPLWLAAASVIVISGALLTRSRDPEPVVPPAKTPVAIPSRPAAPREAPRKPEWQSLIDEALKSGRLPIAQDVTRLAQRDEYRGSSSAVTTEKLFPAATAVEEIQPLFEWPATPDAHYEVLVQSGGTMVAQSRTLTKPGWQSTRALERGKTYRWQVVVRVGHDERILPQPPAPPALFRVVSTAEHEELESAKRERPGDDLLLGVLYARAGVLHSAREHLGRHAARERSPEVAAFLKQLDALVR